MKNFVPDDFIVPLKLERQEFILRPLTVNDVVKDYDAVMTSLEHLKGIFGPKSSWPQPGLTLEQDLIDLGWHQKEFQCRDSFAYTVMTPDDSLCLGCAYHYPSGKAGFDARAYTWVRASHKHLDALLYNAYSDWLSTSWPFTRVAFPGRALSWDEWYGIEDKA